MSSDIGVFMKEDLKKKGVLVCSYCGSEDVWSRSVYLYKINNDGGDSFSFKNFDHEVDLDSFHCWGCNKTHKNVALINAKFFEEWV